MSVRIAAKNGLDNSQPVLIYVIDRWGRRVRIAKRDFENPRRRQLPMYNQFGRKISESESHKVGEPCSIIRENIAGTPEFAQSDAICALMFEGKGMPMEDAERIIKRQVRVQYLAIRMSSPMTRAHQAFDAARWRVGWDKTPPALVRAAAAMRERIERR